MVQTTSIETYHAIKNSGLISEKRLKVFDIFYQNPQGLTGAEVSEIYRKENPTSQHSETIRNRITELVQMGVLVELGVVECQFSKRNVTKWCCIDKMPIPLEKKLTRKEQIKEILDDVTALGKSLKSEEEKIVLRTIYHKIKNLNK
jgi:predicted Zn-ribbon and HTH transcriptional regulator